MVTRIADHATIFPTLLVPELLRAHPETRAVLDRYGLRGCGGRLGPHESIRFFARTHGIDEARLLAELEQAIDNPTAQDASTAISTPGIADTIYRRYFLAGIVLVLTVGATWGAWLLWNIGRSGSFQSLSLNSINAHGEAQIFGWVGLFIMGFAYQAFPRFWHTTLAWPRLAVWAFMLMVAGLVIRTIGMATGGAWPFAVPTALAGGALQVVAVLIFTGQIGATFARSQARIEPYIGFVTGALAWFVVMSVVSVWHTWNTMTARTVDELIWYVATYQAPLRDLQIHGLALFMILGVSLRILPGLFDLPRVPDRRAWWALNVLTIAVFGEVVLFLLYRWMGNPAFAAGLMLPWALLAVGVALIVWSWRPWRPFPEPDRSAKFVRAAYAWLALSLLMLLLVPVHQWLSGLTFSHAYYGAIRHAITVGFVSLMIMGIAAKLVPTLNGIDPRQLSTLTGPFLLVNVGCLLRVSTQTLTDWTNSAYTLIGLSGVLEVAGLAWWGISLIGLIQRGKREMDAGTPCQALRAERIEPHHRVAEVLDGFPQTLAVFEQHGFTALKQPLLRRTIARQVTIAQAATLQGVSADTLLDDLNAAISEPQPVVISLPSNNSLTPSGVQ